MGKKNPKKNSLNRKGDILKFQYMVTLKDRSGISRDVFNAVFIKMSQINFR